MSFGKPRPKPCAGSPAATGSGPTLEDLGDDLVAIIAHQIGRLAEVEKAVNESGTAIGNEHETYSLPQRIRDITAQRDYFMRQTDEARAELAKRYGKAPNH